MPPVYCVHGVGVICLSQLYWSLFLLWRCDKTEASIVSANAIRPFGVAPMPYAYAPAIGAHRTPYCQFTHCQRAGVKEGPRSRYGHKAAGFQRLDVKEDKYSAFWKRLDGVCRLRCVILRFEP